MTAVCLHFNYLFRFQLFAYISIICLRFDYLFTFTAICLHLQLFVYISTTYLFVYISALVVRRTTLTTLIHLLQEDYLKMTAGFFFRILQTMCDEVDEIKVCIFYFNCNFDA